VFEEPVGARGRAPGCGAGGADADEVAVAGAGAGVVRVGGGGFGSAVWGVMPSGFAAVDEMGAFLWIWMGGIVVVVLLRPCVVCEVELFVFVAIRVYDCGCIDCRMDELFGEGEFWVCE
jgi:hypothetical protein